MPRSILHEIRVDAKGRTKKVKLTRARAIRAHCLECMGFNHKEIAKCTVKLCALYPFRLGKNAKEPNEAD